MPAIWTYPWSVAAMPSETACLSLANRGIDRVSVAAHYHSVQSLQPRTPNNLFEAHPGGCHFDPDDTRYVDISITPPVASRTTFGAASDAARRADLDTSAWVVCNHNSTLGAQYPSLRTESAFGDAHGHALCPSNPEVAAYLEAVVTDLAARDIDEIQLESIGYPNAFHGHGTTFGHAKNHAITDPGEQILLSQCFCDACRDHLDTHDVDTAAAVSVVRDLAADALDTPEQTVPPLAALREEHSVIDRLFDARADVITNLVRRLAGAASDTALTYLASDGLGVEADGLWTGGVVPERVAPYFDRVLALCYTDNPTVARNRVDTFNARFPVPIHASVTLAPTTLPDYEAFAAILDAARDGGAADYQVYNHALMTKTHLNWIDTYESNSNPRTTRT